MDLGVPRTHCVAVNQKRKREFFSFFFKSYTLYLSLFPRKRISFLKSQFQSSLKAFIWEHDYIYSNYHFFLTNFQILLSFLPTRWCYFLTFPKDLNFWRNFFSGGLIPRVNIQILKLLLFETHNVIRNFVNGTQSVVGEKPVATHSDV